jgi:hypothetical protein
LIMAEVGRQSAPQNADNGFQSTPGFQNAMAQPDNGAGTGLNQLDAGAQPNMFDAPPAGTQPPPAATQPYQPSPFDTRAANGPPITLTSQANPFGTAKDVPPLGASAQTSPAQFGVDPAMQTQLGRDPYAPLSSASQLGADTSGVAETAPLLGNQGYADGGLLPPDPNSSAAPAQPEKSASQDFIKEQEAIDDSERKDRRLHADGISLEGPIQADIKSMGPMLEQQVGEKSVDEILRMKQLAQTPVTLHVYAVGHAEAVQKINKVVEDILQIGGVFHGAIEVHEKEWSFGGTDDDGPGVFCCEPTRCSMHTYRESVYLGDCKKSGSEVEQILRHMLPDWAGKSYDLFHKNCCSFSTTFAQELGVGPIPEWVHRLAHAGSAIDDDAKAAITALHKVESSIAMGVHKSLTAIGMRGGPDKNKGQQRACRCCWYDFA